MNPGRLYLRLGPNLREVYSNSLMLREDAGHRFGEDLSDKEKKASDGVSGHPVKKLCKALTRENFYDLRI